MYGLAKLAALNPDVQLFPHQERVVNKPGDAVVAAHAVGSGKTLAGLARFEKLKTEGKAHHALVIAPAGLRDNFGREGVGKFTDSTYRIIGNQQEKKLGGHYGDADPNADYNVISYDLFRRNPKAYLDATGADTIIADEFHRGKNEGTLTTDALKLLKDKPHQFIGLTGSLVSNSIADVQPLVDIASGGKHVLGDTKKEFSDRYLKRDQSKKYQGLAENRKPVVGFKSPKYLQDQLGAYIDYMGYEDIKDLAQMPEKKVNVVRVPLTSEQAKMYKALLRDSPAVRRMIAEKRYETLKDEEAAKAFNKLIESRKLMNSVGSVKKGIPLSESAEITPKTRKLLDDVAQHLAVTPDGQVVLLSNLVNGGTDVLEAGLKQRHIPYGKFIGKGTDGVTEEGRQQDVVDYNNRRKRVMIISPAGGEGLSLGDTTFEGVLDPHFNPERMNQMEARGVRSKGLSHRAPEDRVVNVNRYIATMPKTLGIFPSKLKTPDEFIYELAQNKDRQNQMLYQLLRDYQQKQQG